jgi:acyl-coenzyme A thioesterase PaaI-like protein
VGDDAQPVRRRELHDLGAEGQRIRRRQASGEPLHVGKRTQVWEVRIEKAGRLAANFICTQMVLPATG